jgi:hypothetical protein
MHAHWGRRLQRLDPDPAAALNVAWMFAQRRAGRSVASIARNLNDAAIPCPSSNDPGRNPHRSGHRWTVRTVAAILANPRYTGRQVRNRQARGSSPAPSHGQDGRRWMPGADWVISRTVTHPGLVSEDDFVAAQAVTALPAPADESARQYALTGLVRCGACGRRMDAHWSHGRPGYRCRHGHTSADAADSDRPKNLYLSEATILELLTPQLAARGLLDGPGAPRRSDHRERGPKRPMDDSVHPWIGDPRRVVMATTRHAVRRWRRSAERRRPTASTPSKHVPPPAETLPVGVDVSETDVYPNPTF